MLRALLNDYPIPLICVPTIHFTDFIGDHVPDQIIFANYKIRKHSSGG